ncbi:MFS transporter [Cellulomonas sp. JH27-2]|uniref:MFS transporter n=1 Tax=Cellulomonas sp. JH27-2 TaxID=2774139 RepID=UPI00177B0E44|nr:MFS transporter [Cellulomonas sp. JH27-2]
MSAPTAVDDGRLTHVTPPAPTSPARPVAHPTRVTLALSITVLAFSLAQTLVVPALPTIGADLGAGAQATGWILTAFLLAGAVLAPVIGNVGDRLGHRRVLLATLAVFALATVLAALAPSIGVLLGARVLMGASTATFPLALALARQSLPADRIATAFGWIAGMIGLGAGAALVVGGIVVEDLSWRWIFVLGAAFVVVAGAMVAAWVPRGTAPAVARPTDWPGIALLAAGLVGVLLAVSQGRSWGWGSPQTLAVGIGGLVLLALLVVVELRRDFPVVDVRTFRHGPLVLISLLTIAVGFVPYVCYVALPVLLQSPEATGYGHGMSITGSALALLPSAVLVFLGGRVTPALVARTSSGVAAVTSAAVMAVGAAGLALWPGTTWTVVVWFAVLGLGNGIGYAICAQLVAAWSPAAEMGAATGLNSVVRTVGSAAAAPVVTALIASGATSGDPVAGFSQSFWVAAAAGAVGVVVALVLTARSAARS